MTDIRPPQIVLSNDNALHDEVIGISILGLDPWARITLRLETSIDEVDFCSSADFYANSKGHVDVTSQAPVAGSYKSIDAMGLFWSMTAETPATAGPLGSSRDPWEKQGPQIYQLCAVENGSEIASAPLQRIIVPEGVQIVRLTEGRLRGVLFLPPGEGPHPALLGVSGSGGGYPSEGAAALAGRGFAVLALAYFNAPDLPDRLVNIPLEYFEEGLEWLAAVPEVDCDRIGVIGGSRGGELALVLGSLFPAIRAVVAKVPSHVVWPGCCNEDDFREPSWTRNGKGLAAMPYPETAFRAKEYWSEARNEWLSLYWIGLGNAVAEKAAAIPVEKINGPILMISGGDDRCWPASYMADQVMARLEDQNFPYSHIHLRYDDSGHAAGSLPYWPTARLVSPGHPLIDEPISLGGTAETLARSSEDSWSRTLEFLRESL